MNAIKGAVSVLIIELAYWLSPSATDVAFFSLPGSQRAFYGFTVAVLAASGIIIFLHAAIPPDSKGANDTETKP